MLVRGLVVVVEAADARFLRVLNHFVAQNLELQLHKVDLLLQVDNVIVSLVHIGIATNQTCLRLSLLSSELHLMHGLVSAAISVGSASEICTTSQVARA